MRILDVDTKTQKPKSLQLHTGRLGTFGVQFFAELELIPELLDGPPPKMGRRYHPAHGEPRASPRGSMEVPGVARPPGVERLREGLALASGPRSPVLLDETRHGWGRSCPPSRERVAAGPPQLGVASNSMS